MCKIRSKLLGILMILAILFCNLYPIQLYAAVKLAWPVPGHTELSQGFHDGNAIDISDSNVAGATIVAAYGGTVTHKYTCTQQHLGSNHNCYGFGTGVVIKGDDGRIYQYAHMQGNSIPDNVYVGAYVVQGQMIGKVGKTGNASGNHLHFGISYTNYWNASGINPANEDYSGNKDAEAPKITNIKVTNLTNKGYTVSCTVTDNVGVVKVQFPTWLIAKGSDGCPWYEGTKNGNTYTFTFTDGNIEGEYMTHIYAWDAAGNRVSEGTAGGFVDKTNPVITNVEVSDVSETGYTVSCSVTDNFKVSKVQFPTWTLNNDQDDLLNDWGNDTKASGTQNGNIFSYRVNVKDHNNESGVYCTHIYAFDMAGNKTIVGVPNITVPSKPTDVNNDDKTTMDNTLPLVDENKNKDTETQLGGEVTNVASSGLFSYNILDNNMKTVQITQCTAAAFKLTIPEKINGYTVEEIGKNAFEGQKNIEDVSFPNTLKVIYTQAFMDCTGLKSVILPDSLTGLGTYVFKGCRSLQSAVINKGRINIAEGLFQNCSNLSSVKIADTVENVCGYAFDGCTALKSVSLPKSIKLIEANAFRNSGIQSITYAGTQSEWKNVQIYIAGNDAFLACMVTGSDGSIFEADQRKWEVKKDSANTVSKETNVTPATPVPSTNSPSYNEPSIFDDSKTNDRSDSISIKKPSVPKIKLKSVKSKSSDKITISWNKSYSADGYQVSYAGSKNFRGAKSKKYTWSKDKATISGLDRGKTYYARIRAYVKQEGKTYYGKWSVIKKVKVKK